MSGFRHGESLMGDISSAQGADENEVWSMGERSGLGLEARSNLFE